MSKIDLEALTRGEVRSLTGHNRGLAARELFQLDSLDKSAESVVVVAPKSLDAMTPSFVQGLFAASVKLLGKETFFKHYEFALQPHLLTDIHLGVDRVLMKRNIAGT